MKVRQKKFNGLKNQKGILTMDYLFALTLVLGLTTVLFSLSMTLVVSEIVQYMSFASARASIAGHIHPDNQKEQSTLKYEELWNHKTFNSLFKNGWFVVPNTVTSGDHSSTYPQQRAQDPYYFWGVQTSITSKILDINIPFYGSTSSGTSGGSKKGFFAEVNSFLIREPSSSECQTNFTKNRWEKIKKISGSPYDMYGSSGYIPISDNGC